MYSVHELLDNNVQIGLILFKPNISLLFKGNNKKYVLLTFHFSLTWTEIPWPGWNFFPVDHFLTFNNHVEGQS